MSLPLVTETNPSLPDIQAYAKSLNLGNETVPLAVTIEYRASTGLQEIAVHVGRYALFSNGDVSVDITPTVGNKKPVTGILLQQPNGDIAFSMAKPEHYQS